VSGLAFRLGRARAPRPLIPKVLFAHVVSEIAARCGSPADVNRELHRLGVGAGDLVAVTLAALTHLKRLWPAGGDPRGVAGFSRLVFHSAWLAVAGHEPEVSVEVAEGGLVWVELRERAGEGAFYKIVAPEGVNPLYFAAGVVEGGAQGVDLEGLVEELILAASDFIWQLEGREELAARALRDVVYSYAGRVYEALMVVFVVKGDVRLYNVAGIVEDVGRAVFYRSREYVALAAREAVEVGLARPERFKHLLEAG